MTSQERTKYISQIVAAQFRCKVGGSTFFIRNPSRLQFSYAEDIFHDRFVEASLVGAYSDDQLSKFLCTNGIWIAEDEEKLKQLETNIEDQKVGLYEFLTRSKQRETIRKALVSAKKEQLRLLALKHSYDHLSANGIALQAKIRYLLGCSIYLENGEAYWKNEDEGWKSSEDLLDNINIYINKNRIGETQIRELARTDPWRATWNIHRYCGDGVFGCAATDLSPEQKSLLAWSSLYDSAQEMPDCPTEDIIADDDIFDGWLIIKRRAAISQKAQKFGDEQITNEKIRNSSEIFMLAESKEDIKRILGANSEESAMIMKQRMDTIAKQGIVEEAKMPDTMLSNQQKVMERFSKHVKGK